ncbi:MAG: hypothetical protein IJK86_00975 [Lachnospiraceae bacterium]|nr:hypothetical protein [Lachnospiraceae bacterium]
MKETRSRKRGNHAYYRILAGLFAVLFLVFFVLNLVLPDRTLSVREKRMLTAFPAPQLDRVLEGNYSNDFEDYASDQIPFREFFTDLKVYADSLAGRNESQGVYRGRDGYLIEKMETPDDVVVGRTVDAMRGFAELFPLPQQMILVPNAVSVLKDKLPLWAPTADQNAFAERVAEALDGSGIGFKDLRDTLQIAGLDGVPLYYRTDHHWTTDAALACAPAVLETLGRSFTAKGALLPVTAQFSGSLSAKSGLGVRERDTISVWQPEDEPVILVTDSAGKRASLYSWDGLNGSDPYTVFLGGNEGLVRIETDRIGAGRLLVFKDSYFNCFLPFLLDSFETVDIVDPRYYSGDLLMLMRQNEYDQILYFYNINTFSADTSLALVLGEAVEQAGRK